MEKNIKEIIENNKDKLTDGGIKTFFDWITNHKIYTIILLLLIIFGFGKITKHLIKRDK
jgi:hypothetical protein